MRIGYLTYGLDRAPTGIGRYAIDVLQAMATLPNAPELVLLTTEREDRHGLWDTFEHYPLPSCRLLPALMTLGNILLTDAAKRYKLDLIHDPNGIAPFLGPSGGARRVVTIHDACAYVYPETHNRLDNWRYRRMLPQAARRADLVLTDSEHSRCDLERYLVGPSTPVQVIPCGVNTQFAPQADETRRRIVLERYGISQPYLLYLGGINARKNISRLFEAYALLRASHPHIRLVVGGQRQWQTAEMDATFERLGLAPFVDFTGYVENADLPALYSCAEAFVFPSLYEGFGLPPLEAMACDTPVITSRSSSLPEVVGDAALLVDPYDVAELASAIAQVLDDPALRASLRQRGHRRVAQFTWQHTARETITAYKRALSKEVLSVEC
jgi:glycosyltransferase involved in cell wall biosynthesis